MSLPLPLADEEEEMPLPWVLVVGGYGQDAGVSTEVLDLNVPQHCFLLNSFCCLSMSFFRPLRR